MDNYFRVKELDNDQLAFHTIPRHDFGLSYPLSKNPESLKYQNRYAYNGKPGHKRSVPCPNQRFNFTPYQQHYNTRDNKYLDSPIYDEPFDKEIKKSRKIVFTRMKDAINNIKLSVERDVHQMDKYEVGYPDHKIEDHNIRQFKNYPPVAKKILEFDDTSNINYEAFNVLRDFYNVYG